MSHERRIVLPNVSIALACLLILPPGSDVARLSRSSEDLCKTGRCSGVAGTKCDASQTLLPSQESQIFQPCRRTHFIMRAQMTLMYLTWNAVNLSDHVESVADAKAFNVSHLPNTSPSWQRAFPHVFNGINVQMRTVRAELQPRHVRKASRFSGPLNDHVHLPHPHIICGHDTLPYGAAEILELHNSERPLPRSRHGAFPLQLFFLSIQRVGRLSATNSKGHRRGVQRHITHQAI